MAPLTVNHGDPLQTVMDGYLAALYPLDRLSEQFHTMSEAMEIWEYDPFSQYSGANSKLLADLSSAFSQFSSSISTVRHHVEFIHSIQNSLQSAKRYRQALSEDTAGWNELARNMKRIEIQDADAKIAAEESRFPDMQKDAMKRWMSIQFGALADFSKETMIISRCGMIVHDKLCGENPVVQISGTSTGIVDHQTDPDEDVQARLGEMGFASTISPSILPPSYDRSPSPPTQPLHQDIQPNDTQPTRRQARARVWATSVFKRPNAQSRLNSPPLSAIPEGSVAGQEPRSLLSRWRSSWPSRLSHSQHLPPPPGGEDPTAHSLSPLFGHDLMSEGARHVTGPTLPTGTEPGSIVGFRSTFNQTSTASYSFTPQSHQASPSSMASARTGVTVLVLESQHGEYPPSYS